MELIITLLLILGVEFASLCVVTAMPKPVNKRFTAFTLTVLCLLLSVTMYFIQPVPGSHTDLARIAKEMHRIQNGMFQEILADYVLNPLSAVYIGFAACLNDVNILKFTSTLIFVGSLYVILYLEWSRRSISGQALAITAVLCAALINIPATASGVRQGPSSTLAILGAYLVLSRKKSWGWLLLIIATLLHISSSVILILTLVVWINRRLLYILTSVCLLGYTVLSYGAVFILNAMGNPAAAQLWGKMRMYYVFGSYFQLFASPLAQIVSVAKFFICLAIFLLVRIMQRKDIEFDSRYVLFYMLMLMVCIGSLLTGTPFRRFVAISLFAAMPLLGYVLTYLLSGRRAASVIDRSGEMELRTVGEARRLALFRIVFWLMVAAMGLTMVYDWHTFVRLYLSAHQVYV